MKQKRKTATIRMEKVINAPPRLVDGGILVGTTGGRVQELDPVSLGVIGHLIVPDAVTNAPAATSDGTRIFVATYMNEIYAFDRLLAAHASGDVTT